jgi:heme exporter protein A
MTSLPLLRVSNFAYAKAGRILFENLSFTLLSGELIVIMGPNGSGKTTLLRCLAGIPQALSTIKKGEGSTQSYVGHLNALKLSLTVRQNLSQQTGANSEQVTQILSARGLTSLADRPLRTLSVGQQRQVALARLSLSGSKLWLVDEATTHLDEAATTQFWGILKGHLKAGGAAVISSHIPVPIPDAKVITLHG